MLRCCQMSDIPQTSEVSFPLPLHPTYHFSFLLFITCDLSALGLSHLYFWNWDFRTGPQSYFYICAPASRRGSGQAPSRTHSSHPFLY